MKQFLALTILSLSLTVFQAQAVEPTPNADSKAKLQGSQSEGAIKVEKRPAVPAEKLREQDELHAEKNQPASGSASEPHLFGLHADVSIPHPIGFGLNYVHSSRLFSLEVSTGSVGATISDVKAKIQNTDIGLRYHPFSGSFFVGALLGTQKITGEKTATYTGYGSATAKAEIKSTYVTPHLGWMWGGGSSGFFFNFEIGVQSPSGVTTDISSDAPTAAQQTPEYIQNAKDVREQAEKIGKSTLPYMTLIKFGYLF